MKGKKRTRESRDMLLIGTQIFSSVAAHVKWQLKKEASPMCDLSQAVEKPVMYSG